MLSGKQGKRALQVERQERKARCTHRKGEMRQERVVACWRLVAFDAMASAQQTSSLSCVNRRPCGGNLAEAAVA